MFRNNGRTLSLCAYRHPDMPGCIHELKENGYIAFLEGGYQLTIGKRDKGSMTWRDISLVKVVVGKYQPLF